MHTSTASSHTRPLTGHKFCLLFVFLLAILIFYPYVQNGGFGYFAFRVVGIAGILIAVYAIRLRRTLLLVALLLAVPALLERMLPREPDAGLLSILSIVLSFVFDVFIAVVIFRRVFTKDQPQFGNNFRGALHLFAGRVRLCQSLRHGGSHSAQGVLSRSSDESPRYPQQVRFHLLQLRHYGLPWCGWYYRRLSTGPLAFRD